MVGNRIGTEEIESVLHVDTERAGSPCNCAVVGGTVLVAFVVPRALVQGRPGSVAVPPAKFIVAKELPETYGGKFKRRLLQLVQADAPLGEAGAIKKRACVEPLRRTVRALLSGGLSHFDMPGGDTSNFQGNTYADHAALLSARVSEYAATGGAVTIAAGRLSFAFGLQGPCESIHTACSSAIGTLHGAALCGASGCAAVLTTAMTLRGGLAFALMDSSNLIDSSNLSQVLRSRPRLSQLLLAARLLKRFLRLNAARSIAFWKRFLCS